VTDKRTFHLISSRVRDNALAAVNEAEPGAIVSVSPPKRSLEQNSFLHAVLTDLARSPLKWAGRRRTLDEWKALIISAHAVATNQPGEVIPGIEGEFVAIRESSAQMSVKRATSLLEYLLAFCAQHGVELRETQRSGFLSGASLSKPVSSGASCPTTASSTHAAGPSSARSRDMERA
jgi:hypothetical protein